MWEARLADSEYRSSVSRHDLLQDIVAQQGEL
jgi:hypothetical protein